MTIQRAATPDYQVLDLSERGGRVTTKNQRTVTDLLMQKCQRCPDT